MLYEQESKKKYVIKNCKYYGPFTEDIFTVTSCV